MRGHPELQGLLGQIREETRNIKTKKETGARRAGTRRWQTQVGAERDSPGTGLGQQMDTGAQEGTDRKTGKPKGSKWGSMREKDTQTSPRSETPEGTETRGRAHRERRAGNQAQRLKQSQIKMETQQLSERNGPCQERKTDKWASEKYCKGERANGVRDREKR